MILELLQNKIFLSCVIVLILNDLLKWIIRGIKNKKFRLKYFFALGGIPSSHSSFVSALATGIFFTEGVTTLFVASVVFALVIMDNAFGSRYQIGENSKIINKLAKTNLNEVTGHKFREVVAGAVFGVVVTIIIFLI